jgi:hypothetical protein
MDSLAKTFWNETQPTVKPFYPRNSSGWSLWIGQRKLSTWNRSELYNHCNSTKILGHWSIRRNIPGNMIKSIDWEACEDSMKLLGLNRSLWIPKWLSGFAPVGKVMQRYKLQTHAECPRCSEYEDTNHVLQCKAPRAVTKWEASITKLEIWMKQAATMPDLRQAIITRLRDWQNDTATTLHFPWPGVNDLVRSQDRIGWRAFLEGCVLQEWAAKQQEYYTWLQRKNIGRRWITTLI